MGSWLKTLRCPNASCGAIVGGEFCQFCGKSLPEKRGLPRVLSNFTALIRLVTTLILTAFVPWRVGSYLADERKGALSGPRPFLSTAAGLYITSVLTVAAADAQDQHELLKAKLFVYLIMALSFAYFVVVNHAFLRFWGSAKRLAVTIRASVYPLGVSLVTAATLVQLHVGFVYSIASSPYGVAGHLPRWQSAVDHAVFSLWIPVVYIIVQARVHSLRWYKVLAAVLLASPAVMGWYFFVMSMVSLW